MPQDFLIGKKSVYDFVREFGSPVYVFDEQVTRTRAKELLKSNYSNRTVRYAMKAWPTRRILEIVREEGIKIDAVSVGDVKRALMAGFEPTDILLTADIFTDDALEFAGKNNIMVNCGSTDMVREWVATFPGKPFSIRLNPGEGHGHSQKTNTGGPSSKHGIWWEQLDEVKQLSKESGSPMIGCHVHIGSGGDMDHLSRISEKTVELAAQFPDLEFVSFGGGLPVPYKIGDSKADLESYDSVLCNHMKTLNEKLGKTIRMEIEPGRYLVAEAGYLISTIKAVKKTSNYQFILVEAGFSELIRPMAYGSYHEIKVIGKTVNDEKRLPQVVAGPLCESGDVFTQLEGGTLDPRDLPITHPGDLMVILNAGAYGSSMGMNYNSRLKPAEVTIWGGKAKIMRMRETIEQLVQNEQ